MADVSQAAEAAGSAPDLESILISIVVLLAAGVIGVPLFRRIGLGSVLGYLAAGLAIGPFGLGFFSDPQTMLHVAELGVVLFLFIIGLEMRPSRLWSMRGEIFGLGIGQVGSCMLLLSTVGLLLGYSLPVALIAGTGFVLTSTAVVMQMLEERDELNQPPGRRIIAILLLEDLAIVPLLALVAFLAPGGGEPVTLAERAQSVAIGLGAIVALLAAGRWLLDPFFRVLANSRAREVMTAAALLIVLGSALLMQSAGLSMAMGAFLAGVLLSESTYRHQLEADIEPFRGILLGLFFLSVGMSLDLAVVWQNLWLILVSVVSFMILKGLGIYVVARIARASHAEALERAVLMIQGGEFAFVLYASAVGVGLLTPEDNANLTAIIILSMAVTPLFVLAHDRLATRGAVSTDRLDAPDGLRGSALIIGFGRVGQIVSQPLLGKGCSISMIETDPEMIEAAAEFGFKVHYGDGTRLDILHAAGAAEAGVIVVCVDDPETQRRIVELVKAEFPLVPVLSRAYDRQAALALEAAGVDFEVRDTFEAALALGEKAILTLGADPERVPEIMQDVRDRDAERFERQLVGGITAARDLIRGNIPGWPGNRGSEEAARRAVGDRTS